MTANAALHDAKIAAANIVEGNQYPFNYFKVPMVIHPPEIAAVASPKNKPRPLVSTRKRRAPFRRPGKAPTTTPKASRSRARCRDGAPLGGCVVGPEAGEQPVDDRRLPIDRGLWFFKELSYSHPSWAEEETAIEPRTSALKSKSEIFAPAFTRHMNNCVFLF